MSDWMSDCTKAFIISAVNHVSTGHGPIVAVPLRPLPLILTPARDRPVIRAASPPRGTTMYRDARPDPNPDPDPNPSPSPNPSLRWSGTV